MEQTAMSFKEYIWPVPPAVWSFTVQKNVRELQLPFADSVVQLLGTRKRKLEGSGAFCGRNCRERFAALQQVFEAGGQGMLYVPGIQPFCAVFAQLTCTASREDVVEYKFSFVESTNRAQAKTAGVYYAAGGESLWDYANAFHVDLLSLANANGHIPYISALSAGERVVIP